LQGLLVELLIYLERPFVHRPHLAVILSLPPTEVPADFVYALF